MTDNIDKSQKVAFYIFAPDGKGGTMRIGTAFKHKKGEGLNILIGNLRYTAFKPKPKSDEGEGA